MLRLNEQRKLLLFSALLLVFTSFLSCSSNKESIDEIVEDPIEEPVEEPDDEEPTPETLDEITAAATQCRPGFDNPERAHDISGAVNVGTNDDRTCYADYYETTYMGKTWGAYNITHGSNHLGTTLQPRIERSLTRANTNVGSYVKFTGLVRILETGKTSSSGSDGTYIMQAKGKHTGGGGSADPAICLYLAKPVYGPDPNDATKQVQVSFDVYREQINYRGGSGADGRQIVFLTNIKKNVATYIELIVGVRQDPTDASKKIHYADAVIGDKTFNWNIPEPERGTQSGVRYGAYRVKGGRAQIRWADTTFKRIER
ncbi:hypothetical protein [Wenyingzhuangia sp. IMCC45574]